MKTCIALLRGINVGGKTRLLMKDLVSALEGVGARNVETYLQSGNAVFENDEENSSRLAGNIEAEIEARHGFRPRVLLFEPAEIEQAVAANPFPEAEPEPKSLHLFFLASTPENPDLASLESSKAERERFVLEDGFFYLHAPDGFGRSKLAARVEKSLGVPATARNWRTVCKVAEMAKRRDQGVTRSC